VAHPGLALTNQAKLIASPASFLEQIVTSIRMVKVLQASDALIGVYDKLLRDVSA
jgi:hypothetical protein